MTHADQRQPRLVPTEGTPAGGGRVAGTARLVLSPEVTWSSRWPRAPLTPCGLAASQMSSARTDIPRAQVVLAVVEAFLRSSRAVTRIYRLGLALVFRWGSVPGTQKYFCYTTGHLLCAKPSAKNRTCVSSSDHVRRSLKWGMSYKTLLCRELLGQRCLVIHTRSHSSVASRSPPAS